MALAFDRIADLLTNLGFDRNDETSHVRFEHGASNTVITFPISRLDTGLTDADIASTRRHLDEKGLLVGPEFDRLVSESELRRIR